MVVNLSQGTGAGQAQIFQENFYSKKISGRATIRQSDGMIDSPSIHANVNVRTIVDWTILVIAGLFEVAWAIGLKYTEGFSRFWPSAATIAAMIISMGLLGVAMKTLPVGTAYAVWVGVGAVGTGLRGGGRLGGPAGPARRGGGARI